MTQTLRRVIPAPVFRAFCLSALAACSSSENGSAPTDAQSRPSLALVQTASASAAAAAPTEPGDGAAMVVFLDPETGQRVSRPITEAQRQMSRSARARLNRSSEGLEVVHRQDGSMMVNLQGRFQNTSVVRRESDGSLHLDCDTDAEPLGHEASVHSHAPATAPQK